MRQSMRLDSQFGSGSLARSLLGSKRLALRRQGLRLSGGVSPEKAIERQGCSPDHRPRRRKTRAPILVALAFWLLGMLCPTALQAGRLQVGVFGPTPLPVGQITLLGAAYFFSQSVTVTRRISTSACTQ